MQPGALAFLIIPLYLSVTIAVGYAVRRHTDTASKFLHARGSLPTAISALAFFAANCGALEIVGIVATSAKYGVLALDFYWIGAIPAMVALSLLMMPVYLRSGAMTVPDFIRLRYNGATHLLACFLLSVMMVLISGISLYAISMVFHLFFGWSFSAVAITAALVVLCYAFAGGLKPPFTTKFSNSPSPSRASHRWHTPFTGRCMAFTASCRNCLPLKPISG